MKCCMIDIDLFLWDSLSSERNKYSGLIFLFCFNSYCIYMNLDVKCTIMSQFRVGSAATSEVKAVVAYIYIHNLLYVQEVLSVFICMEVAI